MTASARHRRLLVLGLLAVCTAPLAVPSNASARDGQRWPGRTITYYDATRDKGAVRRAVHAWNVSGVRMRFVRVFDRRRANIVIRNTRDVPGGCGTGQATLGYVGRGRKGFVNILHGSASDGQGCAWPGQTFVVAHELGHVLGLDHDDAGCALMNSSHTNGVAASGCVRGNAIHDRVAQWRCRLIEPSDVRRAIRKYGGRYRIPRRNPWCQLVQPPAAPEPMSAAFDTWGSAQVTFRQPLPRSIPPYLRDRVGTPSYELYRQSGSCLLQRIDDAGDDRRRGAFAYNGEPGQDETVTDQRPEPGTWCWSAWALDAFGRASSQPATVQLDVPPLEAALRARRSHSHGHGTDTVEPAATDTRTFALHGDTH